MKILLAASEAAPLVKVGGLADVTTSLSKALTRLGHDVRLIIPNYGCISDQHDMVPGSAIGLSIDMPGGPKPATLRITGLDWGLKVYLLQNDEYFGGPEVYGSNDLERFEFFSRAIPECLRALDWSPDMIHCHDWHTGLVPALMKRSGVRLPSLFTIHNLAYQGQFDVNYLGSHRLGEYVGSSPLGVPVPLNLMALGIAWSDRINTVSVTYASEILSPEYGAGLDQLLNLRRDRLHGILNGLDYDEYDPSGDALIPVHFDLSNIEDKVGDKLALQEAMSLPLGSDIPVISMVQRLDEQKGFDIFEPVAAQILRDSPIQFVIIGQGRDRYEGMLRGIADLFPERVGLHIGYSDVLSHLAYAGSDMFLMPSRYEPCGLGQLIAMRYGSLPIVRLTGGLVDTVQTFSDGLSSGSGFTFSEYSPDALQRAVKRAVEAFGNRSGWKAAVRRVMAMDSSWGVSARRYEALYSDILADAGAKR